MTPEVGLVIGRILLRLTVLLLISVSNGASADRSQYGQTSFPNSGAANAQAAFMQGLLMLHSFEYSDARDAFREAQNTDSEFAMAYWGEALTHYRVLWNEIELDKARAAMRKLGKTPEERADKSKTPRERAYLAAVEILIGDDDVAEKAHQYAAAMERLAADYPDDENAAAFSALALLGSSGSDRDFSIYMKSAAVSEAVFAKNPQHPGAVHYLIHAYDDPVHAPLGLRPALVYSEIAPAATHALHMPSHIFFPLGMWKEASDINTRSYAAGVAWGQSKSKPVNGGGAHALTWLIYSLLQEGKFDSARDHMLQFQSLVGQDANRLGQFTEAWTSYLVETGFDDTKFANLDLDVDSMRPRHVAMYRYVKGAVALKSGNVAAANRAIEDLTNVAMGPSDLNWSVKARDVMILELQASVQGVQGNNEAVIELLEQAVEIEYAMPRRFGPPWPPKPSHELLGEVLYANGDYAGAKKQYEVALELANGRSKSLLGLGRAASKLDQTDDASRAYVSLGKNWSTADAVLPALQEVRNHAPLPRN